MKEHLDGADQVVKVFSGSCNHPPSSVKGREKVLVEPSHPPTADKGNDRVVLVLRAHTSHSRTTKGEESSVGLEKSPEKAERVNSSSPP